MKKITLIIFGSLIFSSFLWSQEMQNQTGAEGQISLPDVVTEIQIESEIAEEQAIPDFKDVIQNPQGSGNILPVLPEIQIQEGETLVVAEPESLNKIYAEGKLGGGYPSLIYGDFSVYELNESSPFKISFTHDSANGYARNSMNDGFNDSLTTIALEKGFTLKNMTLDLSGGYEAIENGFQSQSSQINEMSQNTYTAEGDVKWKLQKGFTLGTSVDFAFYKRYGEITKGSENIEDWVKQYKSFNFSPDFTVSYNDFGFNVNFNAIYNLDTEFDAANRGEFLTDFSWKNDVVKIYSDLAFVVGNKMNDNSLVVPFTAGVDLSIPVSFATSRMKLTMEGGLDSYRKSVMDYEKEYKFSGFSFDSTETSDWNGNLQIVLPVKSSCVATAKIEYRQTALNNGVWSPVYAEENCYDGIYSFEQKNRKLLTTDFGFMLNYNIFSMSANWKSNWIEVPVLENQSSIDLIFSIKDKSSKWNANLLTGFYINDKLETPLISINGMYQITKEVQLLATVDDIVNLCSGKSRNYAGQYISRSGTATFMVKFFF